MQSAINNNGISPIRLWQWLLLTLITLAAILQVILTYDNFGATIDEPAHITIGLEWIEKGSYKVEELHPPLSHIAVALLPYLHGTRFPAATPNTLCANFRDSFANGDNPEKRFKCTRNIDLSAALLNSPDYLLDLSLARAGNLPFFILAIIVVFCWGRRAVNINTGLCAAALLAVTPTILAHAGLATTDIAFTSTYLLACLALVQWLETPTPLRACWLGLATGLCLLSKFSAIAFLPIAFGIILLFYIYRHRRFCPWQGIVLSMLLCIFTLWAGYRFSIGTLESITPPTIFPPTWIAGMPVPMPEFFIGIQDAIAKNKVGHAHYILGQKLGSGLENSGVWYFFPVVLFYKTPLPLLLMTIFGGYYAIRQKHRMLLLPASIAMALFLFSLTSNINIGVRHLLPIYGFMALLSAFAINSLWQKPYWGKALVIGCMLWFAASTWRIHPDYLTYFNEAAGNHPETIAVDSDFDWGQDVLRLAQLAQKEHITQLTFCGMGGLPFEQFFNVKVHYACPEKPIQGWFAVGATHRVSLRRDELHWLSAYDPVFQAGKTVSLYHISP